MKLSLNAAREFLDFDLPPVDELVEKIGAQLGAVEEVVDLSKKYEGIIIVKVVECEKIADSDHLNLCKIDDGGVFKDIERDEQNLIQVVCGAPNVAAGVTVAWLPPGSTVPSSFGTAEPFVLEAREIRGQKSNGMLASPKELAISDSHEGLLLLSEGKPGESFANVQKLNDVVIDIENKMFTHRPDCFGELGLARELAGISGHRFKSPEWYLDKGKELQTGSSDVIKSVKVDDMIPELCPRYMLAAVDNVKIEPSPTWLQSYLSRLGVRPINNIVDMTNYIMLLTGQPLHAFDFDKVAEGGEAHIVIRSPKSGEKMTLLDGKEIEPRAEAILICNREQPIALGGVMGGNNSEIDQNTTRILIECANFDMYSVRRTSMEHGIFTDAVTRFTKGQSAEQCPAVLKEAIRLTQALCVDSKLIGELIDSYEPKRRNNVVEVSSNFINERLGLALPTEEMRSLLENVEFEVEVKHEGLKLSAPFWRTDIELPEDVVEEVGRLYGYDKLPLTLPTRDLTPVPKDPLLTLKADIRRSLSKAGANEVLAYSFVHGNLLEKVGQDKSKAFKLSNAISPDLQYYRLSLMPSLLDKIYPNIKAGFHEFALFELGKTHAPDNQVDEQGLPKEFEITALVVTADDKLGKTGAYYQALSYLNELTLAPLSLSPVGEDMKSYDITQPYELSRSAIVRLKDGGTFLGIIGEFKESVRHSLKLPKYTAGFEIDTGELIPALEGATHYTPLPRFPKVTQDITLKVPSDLSYQELYDFLKSELDSQAPANSFSELNPLDIFQKEDDQKHKNITLRLHIASYERTLTDTEVNKLLDTVAMAAKDKLGAERV